LLARATYPSLGFPQYAGEVGSSDAMPEHKAAAQKAAHDAIAEPLDVFHKFYMDGKPFIGGAKPSIADIRLAATLEFLAVVDYPLPSWAKTFMAAIQKSLGKAYAEHIMLARQPHGHRLGRGAGKRMLHIGEIGA
jgi:glutathione S-transferase